MSLGRLESTRFGWIMSDGSVFAVGFLARPVGAGAFGRVAGRLRGLFKEFF